MREVCLSKKALTIQQKQLTYSDAPFVNAATFFNYAFLKRTCEYVIIGQGNAFLVAKVVKAEKILQDLQTLVMKLKHSFDFLLISPPPHACQ